jgi:3'-phosphoadenosine 5'-phosphosulfate sulfotransferase (PAPS reductase)/FAD synthetase
MNPYTLPEGNVAIAFSGGRTSAYMLHQIIEANGLDVVNSDRVVVSFQNTGREMPETLDFVQECGERWGVRIVWLEYRLRWTGAPHDVKNKIFDTAANTFEVVNHNSASQNGEPMEQLLEYYGFIPTALSRWCTGRLKIKTAAAYLQSLGWAEWTSATGIRADEARRAKHDGTKLDRNWLWHPLYRAGVDKWQVKDFWDSKPFDLRLPNIDGVTYLGNCDGCFLKSERHRAALARDYPERARWWSRMEEKYDGKRALLGKGGGDLNSFNKSVKWSALEEMVQSQGDWIFDTEGALCQADDGECTG